MVTNINTVFKNIEEDYSFEIEPIRKLKEDKKDLIKKITELLTVDNNFTMDIPLFDDDIVFHKNKSEKVSYEDLISIFEICNNIDCDMHLAVKIVLASLSRSITLKSALLTYRELDLKIVSVRVNYRIS